MPEFLERRLRAEARKKGFTGKRADKYVYGGMNNIGAMHGSKETAKGREMEKKHMKDHGIREIRIEVHRNKGKITGHTVHHHMMPRKSSKSGAFNEYETNQFPFAADDHKSMMSHVTKALSGSAADAAANAENNEVEDDE